MNGKYWLMVMGLLLWCVGCAEPVSGPPAQGTSSSTGAASGQAQTSAVADATSSVPSDRQAEASRSSAVAPSPSGTAYPATKRAGEAPARAVDPFSAAGIVNPADPLLDSASRAASSGTGTPAYAAPGGPAGTNYGPPPTYGVPPAAGGPSAGVPSGVPPANAPGAASSDTVRVPAQVGVGKRGRSLDQFQSGVQRVIAEPAKSLFATRERTVFNIAIPHALQLFQAEHGYLPRSHEEFMREIIEANQIALPELPAGHRYVYDPQRGELMVERPAR